MAWQDRRKGPSRQHLPSEVGDFVLRRADGCWTYQWAVVVDDDQQGVTHVVRGEDLWDNTARQLHLYSLLGRPAPRYLHTPLVLNSQGEKLSKQSQAPALEVNSPQACLQHLNTAAQVLQLPWPGRSTIEANLQALVPAWAQRWTCA